MTPHVYMMSSMTLIEFDTKIDNYITIACLKCEPTCKLIKRITASRLFISRLAGLALRPHVESLGKPRDSTNIFKVLPDKIDIKKDIKIHSPSIIYL